jgi:hypothetical protein
MSADRAGSYALELTVSDGVEVSLPDQMTVTAIEDSGGGDSGGDICGCSDEVQRELMRRSGISGAAQRGVAMLGFALAAVVLAPPPLKRRTARVRPRPRPEAHPRAR